MIVIEIPNENTNAKEQEEKVETDRELKSDLIQSSRRIENQIFENRIDREWLTTIEAAHVLAISPNALRILVHRGQIKAYKFGRRLRFRMMDLQALFIRKGA